MGKAPSVVLRRLAAILCADVAGYTRLMHADEAGTLRLLASHREITDRLIGQHGGRIANTAGDSVLAEFPSAVDGLQCALAIQERIAAVNDWVPQDRRVSFRIGLHVGEAMVRDGDLFGDVVNVAARMEQLASPGSVCISGTAYEYVRKVVPARFEDLGPQRVKNLDSPVQAYLAEPPAERSTRALPRVHRIEFYLARRFQEVCRAAVSGIARAEALEPIDMAALGSINEASGLDERHLAQRLGISLARVRRLIPRLERRDLVERSDGLRLTPAGHKAFLRLVPLILAAADRVTAPLSDGERETLKELLSRIVNADEASRAVADRRRGQQ